MPYNDNMKHKWVKILVLCSFLVFGAPAWGGVGKKPEGMKSHFIFESPQTSGETGNSEQNLPNVVEPNKGSNKEESYSFSENHARPAPALGTRRVKRGYFILGGLTLLLLAGVMVVLVDLRQRQLQEEEEEEW